MSKHRAGGDFLIRAKSSCEYSFHRISSDSHITDDGFDFEFGEK